MNLKPLAIALATCLLLISGCASDDNVVSQESKLLSAALREAGEREEREINQRLDQFREQSLQQLEAMERVVASQTPADKLEDVRAVFAAKRATLEAAIARDRAAGKSKAEFLVVAGEMVDEIDAYHRARRGGLKAAGEGAKQAVMIKVDQLRYLVRGVPDAAPQP